MNKSKYRQFVRLETPAGLRFSVPSLKFATQLIMTGKTHYLLPILALVFTLSNPTVTFAQAPTLTIQPTNQVVLTGGTATFTVSASGSRPFEYQWRFNGTNLPTTITTAAGKPPGGYSGDGGAATNAELFGTLGVTVDASGCLFIADVFNNRIRKVDTNGIITTVAGNGVIPNNPNEEATGGYSGDGGPATNAELNWPEGVAVDGLGNLYIADYYNNRVRKVDTNGVITTIAGNGVGGDNVPATNAGLALPDGVALDISGNLYIAAFGENKIRKVDTNGIITTVAGTGFGGYSGDGGPATNAGLYGPSGIALDQLGNLFIADTFHSRIRKVDTNGVIITVAGNGYQPTYGGGAYSGDGGPATNAALYNPMAVAVDGVGNLYVSDTSNNRIRKVDTTGIITTIAGNGVQGLSGDGGPSSDAEIYYSVGMAVDGLGNVFFGDHNALVREIVAQSPIFSVQNVDSHSLGAYDVVVTAPYGSTTSGVAVLTLISPPTIQATLAAINILILQVTGTPNQTNILQSASNLAAPINWQPVFTNLVNTNGNWNFTNDSLAARGLLFYRVMQP